MKKYFENWDRKLKNKYENKTLKMYAMKKTTWIEHLSQIYLKIDHYVNWSILYYID